MLTNFYKFSKQRIKSMNFTGVRLERQKIVISKTNAGINSYTFDKEDSESEYLFYFFLQADSFYD